VAGRAQHRTLQAAEGPKGKLHRPPPVADLVSSIDWSGTALGAPEAWPEGLRDALAGCLNERLPIVLFLGPDPILVYNEAYGRLAGDRHPAAFGARAADIYPEIWPELRPLLRSVVETREDAQSGDLPLEVR
jgi:hypothetical protein